MMYYYSNCNKKRLKKMSILQRHTILERSGILSSDESIPPEIEEKLLSVKNRLYYLTVYRPDIRKHKAENNTYPLTIELLNIIVRNLDISNLRLYSDACLFIVSKLTEYFPMEADKLVKYSSEMYTSEDLVRVESQIFKFVGYNIYLPIASYFVNNYIEELNIHRSLDKYISFYYLVFSIYDSKNILLPSIVAISCIYLALENFITDIEITALEDISGYSKEEILYGAYKISEVYKLGKRSRYRNIFDHYRDTINVLKLYTENYINLQDKERIYRLEYIRKDQISFDDEDIKQLEKVGEGVYSVVYLIEYKNQHKALKRFKYDYCDEGLKTDNILELSLLRTFSNSNIIDLNAINT